jgi:hypothetical protein
MRGIVGLIFTLVVAAIVGVGAYNLGVAQGIATTGTAVAAPAVYYHPFFFGGFGFLFPLLFFFLFLFLLRGAFWGGWGRRYGGPAHGWEDPRSRLEDWHKQAHGEAPRPDGGSSTSAPPTGR